MKKQKSFLIIKIVLLTAVIGGLLYAMNAGAARLNQGQEAESMKQLENSIRKATMTCYATEGVYPPTLRKQTPSASGRWTTCPSRSCTTPKR